MHQNEIFEEDLLSISKGCEAFIKDLSNARILLTGGTGFLGTWILFSLIDLNKNFSLSCEIVVISRNPEIFLSRYPFLIKIKDLKFVKSDIADLPQDLGNFSHIIHGAADTLSSNKIRETVILGTDNILRNYGNSNVDSLIFLSSGAIYGEQPKSVKKIKEDQEFSDKNSLLEPYAVAKRAAEINILKNKEIKNISIARCFAFLGPFMHFTSQFAIGNFIKSGTEGKDIKLNTDGASIRTFLYAADFSIWILKILLRGKHKLIVNVGSDIEMSIKEAAISVSKAINKDIKVETNSKESTTRMRYVPSIEKAKEELDLEVWTNLDSAIRKTSLWYKQTILS
tara:strand:+ start:3242 stop:4261 length:1020 start_codon:yes stop_codon:yes gene_type:complete